MDDRWPVQEDDLVVGGAQGLAPVVARIEQVAPTDAPVLFEGETVQVTGDALNAAGEVCLTGDDVKLTFSGASVEQIDNNHVKAKVRGQGSTVTCNFGDVPSPFVTPIDVVFGSPGIIIIWDPPTRDPAPGYAKSAQAEIFDGDGNPIGEVTSGNLSPFLQKGIGVGYVASRYAEPGTKIQIDIRGKAVPAIVVKPPFYKRTKSV